MFCAACFFPSSSLLTADTPQPITSALRDSRKSVKPQDIMVYEDFAFRMKQAAGITGGQVRGPGTSNSGAGRPLGGSSNAAPVPANPPANQFQQSAEEEDADMYD